MIKTLDVIYIHDDLIKPPGPKRVVCICPKLGLFLRINTKGVRPGSVLLLHSLHNNLLDHDSYVECGAPFELDDYTVEQSINEGRGVMGQIHHSVIDKMVLEIGKSQSMSADDIVAAQASLLAARQ